MSLSHALKILKTLFGMTLLVVTVNDARGQAPITLYQASDSTNNFVPDGPDGTPNRPAGEMFGNTIVLGTEGGLLTGAIIRLATTNTSIPAQDVTLGLYLNDGPIDSGGSGLQQPGTLIDSVTATAVSLGSGIVPVTFDFPSLSVPGSFTFIISFSPGSDSSSYVGVMSDNSAPQVGTAMNTLWYGDGSPGDWTTNSSWAINDGAAANYLDATFVEAIPEPARESGIGIASLGAWLAWQRQRSRARRTVRRA